MSNITKVDFVNKKVRHFQEEPRISRDDVKEAVNILKAFITENYDKKIKETSEAEQVLLHEIEDADEQILRENAEDILLNLKDIRNTRREAKECQTVKKQIESKFTKVKVDNLHHALITLPKQQGSSTKYFNGKVKRSSASKEYLEKALLNNLIRGGK